MSRKNNRNWENELKDSDDDVYFEEEDDDVEEDDDSKLSQNTKNTRKISKIAEENIITITARKEYFKYL